MNRVQSLIDYIVIELLYEPDDFELAPDDQLLSTGIIDSLGLMRLISFIETELAFKVPYEDIIIDNFSSVSQIDKYLSRQLHGVDT